MKVLELNVSTTLHAKIENDQQSTIQKPVNYDWGKKLLTFQAKYRKFDYVRVRASNRADMYFLLDSISLSNGSKSMETSKKRVYFNINLGVQVLEPEEDGE